MQTDEPNHHLLLVEDDENDAFFFAYALQKSGLACSLTHVSNGRMAVDFLLQSRGSEAQSLPGTIFLDLKMPVLNGFEFLDWLRKQTFSSPMRVIVLSGSEQETDKKRAVQLGASDYLVKPIKAGDLQRLLHDVCPLRNGAQA
jgi:CheY-like chemotaxis protein